MFLFYSFTIRDTFPFDSIAFFKSCIRLKFSKQCRTEEVWLNDYYVIKTMREHAMEAIYEQILARVEPTH